MLAHLTNSERRLRLYRRPGRSVREAFTIMELVVVLVLIGIVSAVVAPALWRAATPDTANTLTAPVVSLLRFAQLTAVGRNQTVSLVIDPNTNAYRVQTPSDGVIRRTGTLTFPTQAHFLAGADRLRVNFDPRGGADADSLVVADVQNVAVIRVDPWTGAINVSR
jgi:prepilin-type N-terminal cleavage/methylation domain-containing protein